MKRYVVFNNGVGGYFIKENEYNDNILLAYRYKTIKGAIERLIWKINETSVESFKKKFEFLISSKSFKRNVRLRELFGECEDLELQEIIKEFGKVYGIEIINKDFIKKEIDLVPYIKKIIENNYEKISKKYKHINQESDYINNSDTSDKFWDEWCEN